MGRFSSQELLLHVRFPGAFEALGGEVRGAGGKVVEASTARVQEDPGPEP